ncbi:sensor histidine kinase [Paenibacillus rigui]|uniref:histidine kinase n=1 Tax=Paenibacillus rigui TaxID=554312 RepID=A0A229UI29_9BACL|nr:sensor histidine kinase [Paenibacillus rigui]OXM82569.1 histidine kinase [Paenibacillus rigui]
MRFIKVSIRRQLIALMSAAVILPISISILLTNFFTTKMIDEQTMEENIRLLSEGKQNIATYLDSINHASLSVYYQTKMNDILTNGTASEDDKPYIYTTLQEISQSVKHVYQVLLSLNGDNRAYLYAEQKYYYGTSAITRPTASFVKPYSAILFSTHPSSNYGIAPFPSTSYPVFSLYRPLFNVPSQEATGFLAIDVKLDALQQLSSDLYDKDRDHFFILDKAGVVVFASNDELIGRPLNESWVALLTQGNEAGSFKWDDLHFQGVIVYTKLSESYLDWTIVKQVPAHYMYERRRELTFTNATVSAVLLMLVMIAVVIVSFRLTSPLKNLIRSMNKIQAGQLNEPILVERSDEFGILAHRFQEMMYTINDLIVNKYKLDLATKTYQLKMLQAQMNPHFLHNALQSIGASALDHNAPEVYTLVSSLGQMLHYSMDTKHTIVPLSAEINYVTGYLQLQQQRFEEKLQIELELEPDTTSLPIPKMIIQPLVENFFKHGFHHTQGAAKLRIQTRLQDGLLYILVEDNGKGVAEEQLLKLRQQLAKPDSPAVDEAEGIGLTNVQLRLMLYYGVQGCMLLDTMSPHGFQVTIILPILQQEGDTIHENADR